LNRPFNFSITVSGAPPPTVLTSVNGPPLPAGITLAFTRGVWVISGTDADVTTVGQTYVVQSDATNSVGETGQTLQLTVAA
jgi:hypothetical protein